MYIDWSYQYFQIKVEQIRLDTLFPWFQIHRRPSGSKQIESAKTSQKYCTVRIANKIFVQSRNRYSDVVIIRIAAFI